MSSTPRFMRDRLLSPCPGCGKDSEPSNKVKCLDAEGFFVRFFCQDCRQNFIEWVPA